MASPGFVASSAGEIVRTRPALGGLMKRGAFSLLGFPAGVYMETPARIYKGRLQVDYESGVAYQADWASTLLSWVSASPAVASGESF